MENGRGTFAKKKKAGLRMAQREVSKKPGLKPLLPEWLRKFVDTPAPSQLDQSILAPSPLFFWDPHAPHAYCEFWLAWGPRKERKRK